VRHLVNQPQLKNLGFFEGQSGSEPRHRFPEPIELNGQLRTWGFHLELLIQIQVGIRWGLENGTATLGPYHLFASVEGEHAQPRAKRAALVIVRPAHAMRGEPDFLNGFFLFERRHKKPAYPVSHICRMCAVHLQEGSSLSLAELPQDAQGYLSFLREKVSHPGTL
jgi:hypothetical protein